MMRSILILLLFAVPGFAQEYRVEVSNPEMLPFRVETAHGTITIDRAGVLTESPEIDVFRKHVQNINQFSNIEWIKVAGPPFEYSIQTVDGKYQISTATKWGLFHGCVALMRALDIHLAGPTPDWWIHPDSLRIVEIPKTSPKFESVNYFLTYGHRADIDAQVEEFLLLNGLALRFAAAGHSWKNIVLRNQEAFDENPDWLSDPANYRFNLESDGLAELCANDRLEWLAENPLRFSAPFDPRDGNTNSTDDVITFVNKVASLMPPDKYLGIYGYGGHTLPPTIDVAPNVIVQVKLGFQIPGGLTRDELVEGWGAKASKLGLREYWDVPHWSFGFPNSKICDLGYLYQTYPKYHAANARTITGESTGFFALHSRGLWHLSRILNGELDRDWNDSEYFRIVWRNSEPVRKLYDYWYSNPHISEHFFRRSFDLLAVALSDPFDHHQQRRLEDLQNWLVIQWHLYEFQKIPRPTNGDPGPYWDALVQYMSLCWTHRNRGSVHFYAMARRWLNTNVTSLGRDDMLFNNPDAPWRVETIITPELIQDIRTTIQNRLSAVPQYSDDLIEVEGLPGVLDPRPPLVPAKVTRYKTRLFVKAGSTIRFFKLDAESFSIDGQFYDDVKLNFQTDSIVQLNHGRRVIELLSGNCAIYAGPDFPAWIDSEPITTEFAGSDLWGYTDRPDLQIKAVGSATTYHLIDGQVIRFDKQTEPLDVTANQAYMLQRVNNRGETVIVNSVPWLSFRRDKMLLPGETQ